MSTSGFKYIGRIVKADGTVERMEQSASGDMLKKYTNTDGSTYSGVQSAGQSHEDFLKELNNKDVFEGFRKLL